MKQYFVKIVLWTCLAICLPVTAMAGNLELVGGQYRVVGTNPIYGKYAGTVNINRSGSSYYFYWTYVGIASYDGNGHISGNNQITVEWGLPGQARLGTVVYTVGADGVLKGIVRMYSNPSYRGSETVTPGG